MPTSSTNSTKEAEICRLIDECTTLLQKDPSCLRTRAIRGHACMKAKKWDLAAEDFTAILEVRHDDIYGRFSRGMALFKGGKIERAHADFSTVLTMNPNHVMARYARAGCYNTEGEFGRAIQDYTIALKFDEHGPDKGFVRGESRLYLHETAEKAINDKLSLGYRTREGAKGKAEGTCSPPPEKTAPFKARCDLIDFRKKHAKPTKNDGAATPVARVKIDLTKPSQPVKTPPPPPTSVYQTTARSVKRVTVAL